MRQIEPLHAEADKLKKNKKYEDTSVKYKQAAQMLIGDDLHIPLEYSTGEGAYISEKYQDFTFGKILAMMECCNNITECLEKCSCNEEALDWLEKRYIVQKNMVIGGKFGPPLFGWEMVVHKDRAYLFNGVQYLYYFDLILEEWKTVDTKWTGPGRWPYPKVSLVYPGLAVCHDKLYIFGGMHDHVTVGCNLWIVLDLITFEWRKLGGHAGPTLVPELSMPRPRKHPMIWVEDYAADISYTYDDMWSWDVYHVKWQRERMRGNTPCPRSEVAWTYNPILKKTIIFGGYNLMLPTRYIELNAVFEFSYYADTFIFDLTSNESIQPKWKHVLM
ncbi:hypothetical protein C8Q75DRAFT_812132 [Abortiporus biennis]|nr:hypothetical protein C8Q75DRAFT_812132 [Abortiporus biennis]